MRAAISRVQIEAAIPSRFATAFKIAEKPPAEVMSTGITSVNTLTGGLPRGAITEIFGPASSGRTSLMLSLLAEAAAHEEVCALIDTSDAFDPISATAAKLNLAQLLWIRCGANIEHAFKATDLLLQGGGFGLVVLDLGDVAGNEARRIISSWWYRFRRVVENTPTAFLVIAADSCVRSCASLALEMRKKADVWSSLAMSAPSGSSWAPSSSRAASRLTPFTRHLSHAVQPTHANLFGGIHVQLDHRKPVQSLERSAEFSAVRL